MSEPSATSLALSEHFAALEDPRVERTKLHPLVSIIVIALCAVICGAESWDETAGFGEAKETRLKSFLDLPNGIPSHDTFNRVFAALDPKQFQACFVAWMKAVAEVLPTQVIAIDGKTVRGSLDRAKGGLSQILRHDVERRAVGAVLHEGVSQDRVVSVHDPQTRRGRKSATRRFDGHKDGIAVDPESQLIVAAEVLSESAQDQEKALEVVEQAPRNAMVVVEETLGDCAFGDRQIRQEFAEAHRTLIATIPQRRDQTCFPKDDFPIDLSAMACPGPAGHTSHNVVSIGARKRYGAPDTPLRAFRLDAAICDVCPLRPSCVRARQGHGRLVMLHSREALLQMVVLAPRVVGCLDGRSVPEYRMQLGRGNVTI